ncbi:hypothetical protein RSW84_27310, partial [Escherichia coli]|uniref:hypothetical protein n=1 Tax=Escherichia coli TaxID=562 RepID=UPI0028DF3AE0
LTKTSASHFLHCASISRKKQVCKAAHCFSVRYGIIRVFVFPGTGTRVNNMIALLIYFPSCFLACFSI